MTRPPVKVTARALVTMQLNARPVVSQTVEVVYTEGEGEPTVFPRDFAASVCDALLELIAVERKALAAK